MCGHGCDMTEINAALLAWAEAYCEERRKRLKAVRELVRQSKHYSKVDGPLYNSHEALRRVWPEAVEE